MSEEERQHRFDLLRFAKEILTEEYFQRVTKACSEWDLDRWAYQNNKFYDNHPKFNLPTTITADDIIKLAESFNKYIEKESK